MLLLPTNHLLAQTALGGGGRSGNSKTHINHFGISGGVDTVECLRRVSHPSPRQTSHPGSRDPCAYRGGCDRASLHLHTSHLGREGYVCTLRQFFPALHHYSIKEFMFPQIF